MGVPQKNALETRRFRIVSNKTNRPFKQIENLITKTSLNKHL